MLTRILHAVSSSRTVSSSRRRGSRKALESLDSRLRGNDDSYEKFGLKTYLEKLLKHEDLTRAETKAATGLMLQGAEPSQVAAFLVLLRAKQETAEEILGIVQAMRANMISVAAKTPVLDIVGTGGDGAHTVNISTGAAILAASCGVKVAKHGNRSVSSMCGSADVLEALGVNINMQPEQVAKCIEKVGIGFCFAPNFHPAMQALRDIRKSLGVPTCFNILGPLLNPVRAEYLLIGVFNADLVPLVADIVFKLGVKRTLVFHGNGLDELSCIGPVQVTEVNKSEIKSYELDPKSFGFAKCSIQDLKGGEALENAEILLDVFNGKQGAVADTLIFNAAVAAYVYGTAQSIELGIELVRNSIAAGKAIQLLNDFIDFNESESYE